MAADLFSNITGFPKAGFPKSVETQNPQDLAPFPQRRRRLLEGFSAMSLEALKKIPLPYMNTKDRPKNKQQHVEFFSEFFSFVSRESFDSWITLFPPISQEILRDAALFGCTVLEKYETKNGGPLLPKKDYYYSWDIGLEPPYNLGFIWIIKIHDKFAAGLPSALREAIRPWFAGPPEASLDGCVVEGAVPGAPGPVGGDAGVVINNAGVVISNAGVAYNNALEIAGSFPLLCEALPPLLASALDDDFDPDDDYLNLKPFPKKQLATLRTQCGFKPFPEIYDKAPDALDLASRFILSMTSLKPKRPEDGQEGVKELVSAFFGRRGKVKKEGRNKPDAGDTYKWEYIELHLLSAHLRKKSLSWGQYQEPPPSRKIFLKILTMIAKDGRWFSVSALARYILINEDSFSFVHERVEEKLSIRAASIVADGVTYKNNWGEDDFWPHVSLRYDLLIRPLLGAYCYLFAALGLLEITQKIPAEPVTYGQDKTRPFSPYDALDAVRITDLGRWCLDLITERPGRIEERYEAIADRELLLVTVRGSSFERALYLDAIGEKLGGAVDAQDRWRVSPRSFIAGCANRQDITERINKFKRLIDKNPAPHWEALFSRALERADFLSQTIVPATVYYLGDHRSLTEELLNDPALRSCALRAEGRMLVVPDKHKRKFLDLLAEHGVVYS